MKLKAFFSLLLLGGFIFFISKAVSVDDLRTVLTSFPKTILELLLALSALLTILKAWRFMLLLRHHDIGISFWQTIKAFVASQTTTPLPGGEFMRGLLIHKETDTPMIKTSAPVFLQAFMETFSAGVILTLGSFYFEDLRFVAGLFIVCFSVLVFFIIREEFSKLVFAMLPQYSLIKKIEKRFQFIRSDLKDYFIHSKTTFLKVLTLSLFIHVLGGVMLMIIAHTIGFSLDLGKSMFVYASGVVIQTLSFISPGGVGFTEGGMTGVLVLFGADFGKALAMVLIFRFVTLLFSILLGIVFLILFYTKPFFLMRGLRRLFP